MTTITRDMKRRALLQLGLGGGVVAVAGGIRYLSPRHDELHRLRPTEPFPLLVRNHSGEAAIVSVAVERDDTDLVDRTLELEFNESVEVIEIERAGRYSVNVESEGKRAERDVEVTWEHLADCNSNYFNVSVDEGEVDVEYFRTDVYCGGVLWKSS